MWYAYSLKVENKMKPIKVYMKFSINGNGIEFKCNLRHNRIQQQQQHQQN